jgi:hypothetical protein
MALAPLEVLIYALVIAGKPEPVTCDLKPDKTVVCSNHMSAVEDTRAGGMVFNGTVKVQAARDGRLLFSNGITVMRSSAGWIKFSSGVEARKDVSGGRNTFLVAPDLVCTETSETQAACHRR